jgi:hypothetical protein
VKHCLEGDQLYIISGEPVPYAFGVEFSFTSCQQTRDSLSHGGPIAGLIDTIIGNKERVTLPDKGKHGAPGVYKATGNGLLENKVHVPVFNYNTTPMTTTTTTATTATTTTTTSTTTNPAITKWVYK